MNLDVVPDDLIPVYCYAYAFTLCFDGAYSL